MKTSLDCNGVKTCPDCNGDGVVDKDTDDERQCPTCGGLGFVPDDDKDHEEVIKTSRDLPHRQGAAWTRLDASRPTSHIFLLCMILGLSAVALFGSSLGGTLRGLL